MTATRSEVPVTLEMSWPSYKVGPGYDEIVGPEGSPWDLTRALWRHVVELGPDAIAARQRAADREVRMIGVTFRTSDSEGPVDRPWPFDVIPRIVDSEEWSRLERGLTQRLRALNMFIDDVYRAQRCVQAGVVPTDVIVGSPNFRPECVGVRPPGGIWAHICGSDLVRDEDGVFYVLEDNLRVPSGVSYLLENRMVSKHVLPELFRSYSIEPVDPYIGRLGELLAFARARGARADDRCLDARHPQPRVLRARLSGPTTRRGARRGERPCRAR